MEAAEMRATSSTNQGRESRIRSSKQVIAQVGWVLLALLALATVVVSIPGYFAMFLSSDLSDSEVRIVTDFGFLNILLSVTAAVISLALAALLFWRKRDDRMALFLAYFFIFYGIVMAGPLEAATYLFGNDQFALLSQTLFLIPVIVLFFIFPTGTFIPRWSRWLVPAALLITPPMVGVTTNLDRAFESPWSIVVSLSLLILLLLGFYSQVIRYRRISSAWERQQVKWVLYGWGIWFLVSAISSGPYTYQQTLPRDAPIPGWMAPLSVLWWIGLIAVPVSFTVAVLRYRLWDIDLVIRRTLLYGLLTALLLFIYFGSVVVIQTLFTVVSGQQSAVAIVISTLIIAALFMPLRRRLQSWIDRRFFRAKYDAAETLASFAETARDEVDLEQLSLSLIQAVNDTMQPKRVSLWLKEVEESVDQKEVAAIHE